MSILEGGGAGEILFNREGLLRDFTEIQRNQERTAAIVKENIGKQIEYEDITFDIQRKPIREYKGCYTMSARMGTGGNNVPCIISYEQQSYDKWAEAKKSATLKATGGSYGGGSECIVSVEGNIRKLNPRECAKLQGMPSWWASDIEHKDAEEYKMWGNGVALPCALYIAEGIKLKLESED